MALAAIVPADPAGTVQAAAALADRVAHVRRGRADLTAHSLEPVRPGPLAFLPRPLFMPTRPARYVAIAWATAFLPSLLLSAFAGYLLPEARPDFPKVNPGLLLFLLVVFAPVVETLIMGTVLLLLERLFGFVPAILLSALGWGIAHSLQAAAWGLVIWWPFLIFSTVFLVWRRRSLAAAFALPMVVHGLQNLGPALLLVNGLN